jgi:hypothetical protein
MAKTAQTNEFKAINTGSLVDAKELWLSTPHTKKAASELTRKRLCSGWLLSRPAMPAAKNRAS